MRAIVVIGSERAFSSGADIKEFSGGTFYADPFLPAVCDAIEAAPKPVIAAISGACMGGGLELALGLPLSRGARRREDRLPRGEAGTDSRRRRHATFPATGRSRNRAQPDRLRRHGAGRDVQGTPLFDVVTDNSGANRARCRAEFARKLRKQGHRRSVACGIWSSDIRRPRPSCSSRGPASPRWRAAWRRRRALEAVAASMAQSFDQGIATERRIFSELMASPESQALRHAFFAERAASKVPGLTDRHRSARSSRSRWSAPAPWAAASR